mgnify:CR=1 FL=1
MKANHNKVELAIEVNNLVKRLFHINHDTNERLVHKLNPRQRELLLSDSWKPLDITDQQRQILEKGYKVLFLERDLNQETIQSARDRKQRRRFNHNHDVLVSTLNHSLQSKVVTEHQKSSIQISDNHLDQTTTMAIAFQKANISKHCTQHPHIGTSDQYWIDKEQEENVLSDQFWLVQVQAA